MAGQHRRVKFFVDENLSPSLADVCHHVGYEATSSRGRGMLGRTDREVLDFAIAEDAVIVTNNANHFRELCRTAGVHPGLIVIESTARPASELLFAAAIRHIEVRARAEGCGPRDFMLNRAVEVELDGSCADYDIPASA